jgi:hypothetical protein
MTEEDKYRLQAQAARLVHMNEEVVFPLLKRNIDQAVGRLVHEFRKDPVPLLNEIAYIAACKDLLAELEAVTRAGNRAVIKLQQEP